MGVKHNRPNITHHGLERKFVRHTKQIRNIKFLSIREKCSISAISGATIVEMEFDSIRRPGSRGDTRI